MKKMREEMKGKNKELSERSFQRLTQTYDRQKLQRRHEYYPVRFPERKIEPQNSRSAIFFPYAPLVVCLLLAALLSSACQTPSDAQQKLSDRFVGVRREMVTTQLAARDITDPAVLRVMGKVPRHRFVLERWRQFAYIDRPLPIGEAQTISQPYIVAYMTQVLQVKPGDRVLEIGTGSGYQAAVLAELVKEVYTIEIVPVLAERSKALLKELSYDNIHVRTGDGYLGWPEAAPFNAVIVTAAPGHIPQLLVEQLGIGGRMVLPVGEAAQQLIRLHKTETSVRVDTLFPVRFVPMTGKAQER